MSIEPFTFIGRKIVDFSPDKYSNGEVLFAYYKHMIGPGFFKLSPEIRLFSTLANVDFSKGFEIFEVDYIIGDLMTVYSADKYMNDIDEFSESHFKSDENCEVKNTSYPIRPKTQIISLGVSTENFKSTEEIKMFLNSIRK